jgi:DNA-binding transcriptional regulator YhcF (GntR family)
LLLLASHSKHTVFIRRGIKINLKPGDLCYSQQTLAERWKWNFKTVRTFLTWLEELEMVEVRSTNVTTVISIKNWEWYQKSNKQNGEQSGDDS